MTELSRAAEQSVIGGILLDQTYWPRLQERLSDSDFQGQPLASIWRAGLALDAKGIPVDMFSIEEYFKSTGNWDHKETFEAVAKQCLEAAPLVVTEAEVHADIVRRKAGRNALVEAGRRISSMAEQPGHDHSLSRILEDAHGIIADIEVNRMGAGDWEDAATAVADELINLEKMVASGKPPGLSTGLSKLDDMLGGLHRGDVVVIGGASSMGKTALATNIARGAALAEGVDVGFMSGEMTREQLAWRMASCGARRAGEGKVEYRALRTGALGQNELAILKSGMRLIPKTLSFNYKRGMTLADIRSTARRLKKEKSNLAILVVDYLQILNLEIERGENKASALGRMTMGLKVLAGDLNVCIVLLSQVARMKGRDDKRPTLDDLRESGAIEQDSDVVMFAYREDYYLERSEPPWTDKIKHTQWWSDYSDAKGVFEAIIRKNRMGDVGTVLLHFEAGTDCIVDDKDLLEDRESML